MLPWIPMGAVAALCVTLCAEQWRREQAWLSVVDRQRTNLYAEHYVGEPVLPNPQTADLLPPGRYQFWGHEILEIRRRRPEVLLPDRDLRFPRPLAAAESPSIALFGCSVTIRLSRVTG